MRGDRCIFNTHRTFGANDTIGLLVYCEYNQVCLPCLSGHFLISARHHGVALTYVRVVKEREPKIETQQDRDIQRDRQSDRHTDIYTNMQKDRQRERER